MSFVSDFIIVVSHYKNIGTTLPCNVIVLSVMTKNVNFADRNSLLFIILFH